MSSAADLILLTILKARAVKLVDKVPTMVFLTVGEISMPQRNLYLGISYRSTREMMVFSSALKDS